jgi:hypothetical protein
MHLLLLLLFGSGLFQVNLFSVIVVIFALFVIGIKLVRGNVAEEIVGSVRKDFVCEGGTDLKP